MNKIPKVIHYCWFGGKELPESAKKCIQSWKKFFPDYEIKEWNESNFDLNYCKYVQEAFEQKKWAFVSDVARFWILYNYGGLYFDTDVEVIANMDDIIDNGPFMGMEKNNDIKKIDVNPGLGIGAFPGMDIYEKILNVYKTESFVLENGKINPKTIIDFTTDVLKKYGLTNNNSIQNLDVLTIYPDEFFCPMNYYDGSMNITPNTKSIHWYDSSWLTDSDKKIMEVERKINHSFIFPFNKICCFYYRYTYRFFEYVSKGILMKKIKDKIFRR